jgi:hypothetical protein
MRSAGALLINAPSSVSIRKGLEVKTATTSQSCSLISSVDRTSREIDLPFQTTFSLSNAAIASRPALRQGQSSE